MKYKWKIYLRDEREMIVLGDRTRDFGDEIAFVVGEHEKAMIVASFMKCEIIGYIMFEGVPQG